MIDVNVLTAVAEEMNLRPLSFPIGKKQYFSCIIPVTMRADGLSREYVFRVICQYSGGARSHHLFFQQISPPECHPHHNGTTHFCFGDNEKTLMHLFRAIKTPEDAKAFFAFLKFLLSRYTANAYGVPGYRQVETCACLTGNPHSTHCKTCLVQCSVSRVIDIPDHFRFITIGDNTYAVHKSIHPSTIKTCLLCQQIIPLSASTFALELCPKCAEQRCTICEQPNNRIRVCNILECPRRKR